MDRRLPVGVKPKKRFGQNFLVDKKVVADLIAAAELSKSDTAVEIGAGTGALTKELAKKAKKVIAFEIDKDLIPILRAELEDFDNVEIINDDFLTVEDAKWHNYIALHSDIKLSQIKIVGSIPYQITSPLIHKLLTLEPRPSLVVLLIQREMAEKICAQPPRATYLSNTVQLLGEIQITDFVPQKAFWPQPKVGGAIVKWKTEDGRRKTEIDYEEFCEFLHRGFENPRKMLRNKFDPQILRDAGIAPTQRAQRLSLEKWLKLWRFYRISREPRTNPNGITV